MKALGINQNEHNERLTTGDLNWFICKLAVTVLRVIDVAMSNDCIENGLSKLWLVLLTLMKHMADFLMVDYYIEFF